MLYNYNISFNSKQFLIEANIGMVSFKLCQMSLGIPAFGD